MRRATDPGIVQQLIEEQKLTQREVAARLGVSVSCIERTCKRLGLATQRTGPRDGDGHPDWKGGRVKIGRYWYVWAKGHPNATKRNYLAEHRKVVSDALGRPLLAGEVVHHRDGNPENNQLANLEIFQTNALHLQEELTGRCPNWTPQGRARLAEFHGRSANFLKSSKLYGPAHTQTTDR